MNLFELVGTIAVDNQSANANIDETTGKAETFHSKLASGVGTVAKWGAGVVAGTATAVGGLVEFAQSTASTADHIDKMSQKIGISRQAYQELDFICSQSGTSVDGLQAGIKSLTSAMDGAASGTEKNIEQFQRLGVEVQNADGSFRSQEDVFFDTISALQGVEDQTEKARLATELFGRSGTELMPLLNGEAGSIEEMKKQAHELGLVLDDELIDNGVNLTDSLDQTKRAFTAIATNLGGVLMPIVEQASDYIQQSLPQIQSLVGRIAPLISSMLEQLLPPLMELAEALLPVVFDLIEQLIPPLSQILSSLMPVIISLLQMLLPPIMQIVQMALPIVVQLLEAIMPLLQPIVNLLQPIIDLLMQVLEPLVQLINFILPPLISLMTWSMNFVLSVVAPLLSSVADMIGNVLITAIQRVSEVVNIVVTFVQDLLNKHKDEIETVFNGIRDFIVQAWEICKDLVLGVVDLITTGTTDKFNSLVNKLKSLWDKWVQINDIAWGKINTAIANIVDSIKNTISNGFTSAQTKISSILDNIKSKFTSIFDNVKTTVSNAIEYIKSKFNFTWSLPKLKLPHFKISGSFSLDPPSVPSFGVEWYKKAMETPYMFTEPTVFAYGNTLKGAGESGDEIMYGRQNLMSDIGNTVAMQNNDVVNAINTGFNKVVEMLNTYLPNAEKNIVLDSGVLVGQLAPAMDSQFGRMAVMKGRGR